MKKIRILLAALLATVGAAAQNPSSYFMEGSTFRSQLNPAFAPQRGYVNFPVLGGIQVGMSGNISLDKIFYPRDGKLVTLLDSSVSAAEALSGLKDKNLLGADTRINVIGFGAYTKNHKNFWSFDLNVRVNAEANIPYSLFDFIKNGQEGRISDIGVISDSYLEAAFSYSFPLLDDRLYVGVRGKFLAGIVRAKSNFNRFDVSLNEDRWAVEADGSLDISAAGLEATTEMNDSGEMVYTFDDIDFKPTSPTGYGFAVDLGATYDILPDLQASLAINDLGFIGWGKGNTLSGRSVKNMEFTGVTVDGEGTSSQPDFNLDVLEFQKQEASSATRMLRATVNAGLEYKMWQNRASVGLLYTMRFWEYKTLHNITGSVNFRPIDWFHLTGSYTVIGNNGGALGLALNLCPGWINFFVATDVLMAKHTPQWIPAKFDERHARTRLPDRQARPPRLPRLPPLTRRTYAQPDARTLRNGESGRPHRRYGPHAYPGKGTPERKRIRVSAFWAYPYHIQAKQLRFQNLSLSLPHRNPGSFSGVEDNIAAVLKSV